MATATRTGRTTRFRPELHGLRAVAVALVVVYHVWFDRVSGGVDVFFVLTGFLLTGQLARAADRGSVPLVDRWRRTLLRLLPAAVVVLLGTVVAGVVVLPESRWVQSVQDVLAAAVLLENWQLVAASTDYTARNDAASVVQHFWSLSIQVQVMLVAPVLALAVAYSRRQMATLLAAITVASLCFSIVLTAVDQPFAYFHTLTRLWEFTAGGLLALVIDRVELPARVRVVLGWAGLVGLVSCGMVLQVSTVFPGYAALWPVGCAALVLVAGPTGSRFGADRLLTSRPLARLADLSYALYLWHWPVLVLTLVATRQETLDLVTGSAVIAASLLLAAVTHRLVERPLAGPAPAVRPQRVVAVGAASLVALTACGQHLVPLEVHHGRAGDALRRAAGRVRGGPGQRHLAPQDGGVPAQRQGHLGGPALDPTSERHLQGSVDDGRRADALDARLTGRHPVGKLHRERGDAPRQGALRTSAAAGQGEQDSEPVPAHGPMVSVPERPATSLPCVSGCEAEHRTHWRSSA